MTNEIDNLRYMQASAGRCRNCGFNVPFPHNCYVNPDLPGVSYQICRPCSFCLQWVPIHDTGHFCLIGSPPITYHYTQKASDTLTLPALNKEGE